MIIDDNSPDGTQSIVKDLQKIYPGKIVTSIQVLHTRPGKLGLGSAYIEGIQFCSGDFVILMDADLSHHPKYIPQFIQKQTETHADIVTGTRYRRGGGVFGWNLRRKLTSRVANFLASLLLNPDCSDLTGSFRLYKKEVLQVLMQSVKSRGYAFQMEVVIRARERNFSIAEVPIAFVDRIFGESKLGPNEIYTYLKGLWSLFWEVTY